MNQDCEQVSAPARVPPILNVTLRHTLLTKPHNIADPIEYVLCNHTTSAIWIFHFSRAFALHSYQIRGGCRESALLRLHGGTETTPVPPSVLFMPGREDHFSLSVTVCSAAHSAFSYPETSENKKVLSSVFYTSSGLPH
jgi:hypothetical protein